MSLRRLLPTLDNAGRRLVLAEVLGQPVSMRHARRRGRPKPPERPQTSTSLIVGTGVASEARELPKVSPLIEGPSAQGVTEETAIVDMRSLIEASEVTQVTENTQGAHVIREEDDDE